MRLLHGRKSMHRFLLLALIVGALLGGYYWFQYRWKVELRRIIAELDANDPGWRLEEIHAARKSLPPEKNGYCKIAEAGKTMVRHAQDEDLSNKERSFPVERRLNAEQEKLAFAYLERNAKSLALARELAWYDDGTMKVVEIEQYLPNGKVDLRPFRAVARCLNLDVYHHLQYGGLKEANQCVHGLFNTVRALDMEACEGCFMMRGNLRQTGVLCVERILARGTLTDDELKTWQARLQVEETDQSYTRYLRGQRAVKYYLLNALYRGEAESLGIRASNPPLRVNAKETAWLLDHATRVIKAFELSPKERPAELMALMNEAYNKPGNMQSFILNQPKVADHHLTTLASLRCLRAALGVERFRLKHARFPQTLDEVYKNAFLTEVPVDPYDGEPLRLKATHDGVIVYSVSRDRVDGGGAIAPYMYENDCGVRLWLPELRNGSPLPTPPITDEAQEEDG